MKNKCFKIWLSFLYLLISKHNRNLYRRNCYEDYSKYANYSRS